MSVDHPTYGLTEDVHRTGSMPGHAIGRGDKSAANLFVVQCPYGTDARRGERWYLPGCERTHS